MANKTALRIITPHGLFWDKEVEIVTVKTTEGYMGLLHGKSPVVASLAVAELQINKRGSKEFVECAIAGGIVYVTPEKVEIITDAIEEKSKIDVSRAEKAMRQAEIALKQKGDDSEHNMAEMALKRAMNRISVKKA
ncbi:MAG: ATP synthase F1 subunit epsilon [Mycoplasmataceae bacterium]|nr:ATP synthase F1 subunit epsilon [Mycoplasmataceae bacterium]